MSTLWFASWTQPAAAAANPDVDPVDSVLDNPPDPSAVAAVTPVAQLREDVTGATPSATSITPISLLGPEHIIGLQPGQITGRSPAPGSTGSEAVNLAAVEFGATDLPWRFTPARAGGAQRLRPWLVLIVTPVEYGVVAGQPLPVMTVPVQWLPDLAESWAWAHVQLGDASSGAGRSRLLCPWKLPPDQTLQAAVVPAFHGGVQAGLGKPVDPALVHTPAWTLDQPDDAVLPVYDSWQFATGQDADFEFLARRIRPASPTDLGANFGYRQIDITSSWLDADPVPGPPVIISIGGALRPLGDPPTSPATPADFTNHIVADINTAADGKLGPPLRGGPHVGRTSISGTGGDWLDDANREPSHRMAAARGTDWVQANQEQLMAAAWSQAGQIRQAAGQLGLSRAAAAVTDSLQKRHVKTLSTDELIAVTAPAAGRLRLGGPEQPTLQAALAATALPQGAASTAMARLTRRAGTVGRATQSTTLTTRAAAGALSHALAAAGPSAPLSAVASAPPAPKTTTTPPALAMAITSTRTNITATAATALWVGTQVAASQGIAIATTFTGTDALPAATKFIEGPAAVTSALGPELVSPVAQHIISDQLTVNTAAPPATVAVRRDGLVIDADALAGVLGGAVDASTAVRRRLAATVERSSTAVTGLDVVLATPDVPTPMATALLDRDPEWFLPGLGDFLSDRATLLGVDDTFVESVMLGANTELLSEFLWREFPTDRRGTPIRRFWPRPDNGTDIDPINLWAGPLGSHTTTAQGQMTVILIRAELFLRYPTTVVLAARAETDPADPNRLRPIGTADTWQPPMFTLTVDVSTRAIAFAIPSEEVQAPVTSSALGWFFVLIEPATGIRFGFDLASDPPVPGSRSAPPAIASWNDLTWDHVIDERGFATARQSVTLTPPAPAPQPQWGGPAACAADVARIALRRPVLVALHASTMVSPGS